MQNSEENVKTPVTLDVLAGSISTLAKTVGTLTTTIDDLAIMIKDGFDAVDKRFEKIENTMATKEDLTREIGTFRSGMIDYIGKQNIELKTDLVILMRGEDRKVFSLVELLVEKNILTKADANRITNLEPFPQAV